MWTLTLAVPPVLALVVLVWSLRVLAHETASLRVALRRHAATAVAGDELVRIAAEVGHHAVATRAALDRSRWRLRLSPRFRRRR